MEERRERERATKLSGNFVEGFVLHFSLFFMYCRD